MKGTFLKFFLTSAIGLHSVIYCADSSADDEGAATVLLQIPEGVLPKSGTPVRAVAPQSIERAPKTNATTRASLSQMPDSSSVLPAGSMMRETNAQKAERLLARGGSFRKQFENMLEPLRLRFERNLRMLGDNLLTFRTPKIEGNYRLQGEEILWSAGLASNSWIWDLSPGEIQNRIEQLPWIEQAQLNVGILPSSVTISVKEAEPWLVAEYEGSSWLVSSSGKLLQTLSSIKNPDLVVEVGELPRLDGLEAEPGVESYLASANARFVYAAKLVKFIEMGGDVPFPFDRITLLRTGGLRVTPVDKEKYPEVLLTASSLEETSDALQRLTLVLGDLEKRNERAKQIDLRFNNQAILR